MNEPIRQSRRNPSVARTMPCATKIQSVTVNGQLLRVGIRRGAPGGVPLLIFNGIGANLELMEPFTSRLEGIETVIFDVPGVGGSPAPTLPYRFWMLARLANRLMTQLGHAGQIDVLGVSWGGALAQQFALLHPKRCRRLVLAATSMGSVMVPGRISVLSKMVDPRRYTDPQFLRKVGGQLYGGEFRHRPELLKSHGEHILPPGGRGYLYQLIAGAGWSSLPWLPLLRQRTLVLAGTDDPIVPPINARLMASLIRKSGLELLDDGHLFLVTKAAEVASRVRSFLAD
jgi:poly(3-hydroxyalkanoate) depolymerase